MSAISWAAAQSPVRKNISAAVSWRSAGTAPSRSSLPPASSGRFSKTAIRSPCAAGARATAIASDLVRSRGRSWRRSRSRRHCERSETVGWAKAHLRRAHHLSTSTGGGHASLCPPYAAGSPLLRRNIPQPGRMRGDILKTVFQMHALVRWQLLLHAHTRPPLGSGPDRPRHKTAAAVRADVVKLVLDAIRAERAFIRTYPRFRRVRRQILVAIFAVWPKLQRHGISHVRLMLIIANRAADSYDEFPSIWAMRECHSPSPRSYGERVRGDGLSPQIWTRGWSPQPGSQERSDLFPQAGRGSHIRTSFSGSFELSFSRSSTIDERTCATLWCGISTLLTMSDRLLRSRSISLSR